MKTTTDYNQQAIDFLNKCNTTFEAKFIKHDFYFNGDKEKRDIYLITLKRGSRIVTFEFGQSLQKSGKYIVYDYPSRKVNELKGADKYPSIGSDYSANKDFEIPNEYELLSSLTKYEVGTFENFCSEFGYDEDSRNAEKTYKAVCEEYLKVCKIFNEDEMQELQEIQ